LSATNSIYIAESGYLHLQAHASNNTKTWNKAVYKYNLFVILQILTFILQD